MPKIHIVDIKDILKQFAERCYVYGESPVDFTEQDLDEFAEKIWALVDKNAEAPCSL